MKVKKRKNWLLDKMATFVVVASMVASIAMIMVPNNSIKADEYISPQAFSPVNGSLFSFDIKPGIVTRVRTAVDTFDSSVTDGHSSFVSFGFDSSDTRIAASDLKISSYNSILYPNPNEQSGDLMPYTDVNGFPQLTFDFRITSADDLPEGEYSLTLYGVVMKNSSGAYEPSPTKSMQGLTQVNIPLINYTIKNTVPQKSAEIKVVKISLSKDNLEPGSSNELIVRVQNTGKAEATELIANPGLDLKNFLPDYEMKTINIGSLKPSELKTVKIPFIVGKNVENGMYEISVSFEGIDIYEKKIGPVTDSIYVTVGAKNSTSVNAPNLTLYTKQNYRKLKPSTDDSVIIRITNTGDKKATKVRLSCDSGFGVESALTKNYTDSYIKVDDIEAGETVKVEVPFMVGATFTKGVHELTFSASFMDEDKNAYTSEKMTMYVEHYKTGEVEEEDGHTYLQISGVSQSPASPMAGQRVTVSFNVKNKGTEKIKDLHFYGTGLAATGFQPVSGEPYQNEGSLDAGESKKVTMTFMAGEDIPNGVNALAIGYDYFDSKYEQKAATTTIFVLNVINHKFDVIDVGRPKIIVSDYSTEPEIIRAGDTFDFTYTLKNTHTGKEARNIKITLSQAEGVLAPAQGTNIFYIDKLDPSQEVELSLPLKSRSDTVTGDYPVVLKLEYEYDDMSEIDKEHGGVSEENTLKIRVIENYRPVIENIYIDAYQGIIVGQPVDLNFEFYNMGKSTLGNVYITIEGDFALANNSAMSYVGAVQGYGQEYLSPQIVPLVGGESHGTVTIHFEDSNGDEQTKSSDFQAWVEDPMGGGDFGGDWNMNFGNISGGYYNGDWGGDFPFEEGEFGMEGDSVDKGFFESIPWWGWVIAGVVLVGGVVVVVIVVKKHKKKKESDEEDNEDI